MFYYNQSISTFKCALIPNTFNSIHLALLWSVRHALCCSQQVIKPWRFDFLFIEQRICFEKCWISLSAVYPFSFHNRPGAWWIFQALHGVVQLVSFLETVFRCISTIDTSFCKITHFSVIINMLGDGTYEKVAKLVGWRFFLRIAGVLLCWGFW